MTKVIVTGILGQDGANMAEFLLDNNTIHERFRKGLGSEIEVYGMMRRSSNPNFINTHKFKNNDNFKFVYGDLTDDVNIDRLVKDIQPDYFINFAANSFVGCSWDMPEQVLDANSLGFLRCMEAIHKF